MTTIVRATGENIAEDMTGYCELLCDVVDGGASVNFIAPLEPEVARSYWTKVATEVQAEQRVVVAALEDGRVVGCAHLVPATQPNGPHRAEVQKVLVHSAYRRRGIAQALMAAIEDEARAMGRWLLVLDTEEGSGAQPMYEKLGYTSIGGVPEFALNSDGTLRANVIFFKRLTDGDASS